MSVLWSARFLGLVLCDFHIWGTANQTAANQNETIAELKETFSVFQELEHMNVSCFWMCAKLKKANISCLMSVSLSAWNNSAPTGRIFLKFDI
jgi:hypothetical protein